MSAPARERLLAAGHDDRADAVVGIEGLERMTELVHQRIVQRVQLLRSIQRDQAGLARAGSTHFGEDAVVVHRGCPR
jgi:hypothetical protein